MNTVCVDAGLVSIIALIIIAIICGVAWAAYEMGKES